MDHRLWMYNMHYETGAGLKPEFIDGVRNFIEHTMTLDIFKNNGLVGCPCSACKCLNFFKPNRVMVHLYRNGFKPRYLYGLIMEKVMDWMVSFIIRCMLMYIIWLHHMAKLGLNKVELNMIGLMK